MGEGGWGEEEAGGGRKKGRSRKECPDDRGEVVGAGARSEEDSPKAQGPRPQDPKTQGPRPKAH